MILLTIFRGNWSNLFTFIALVIKPYWGFILFCILAFFPLSSCSVLNVGSSKGISKVGKIWRNLQNNWTNWGWRFWWNILLTIYGTVAITCGEIQKSHVIINWARQSMVGPIDFFLFWHVTYLGITGQILSLLFPQICQRHWFFAFVYWLILGQFHGTKQGFIDTVVLCLTFDNKMAK